jgi:glycerol-3-phosphate O-acyltransferase
MAIAGFVLRNFWRKLRGRFKGFGTAAAGFGHPVSLRAFYAQTPTATVEDLGPHLMQQIERAIPVTPVPLIAAALMQNPTSRADLIARVSAISDRLVAAGAVLKLPPQGVEAALDEGLIPLTRRGLVGDDLRLTPGSQAVVAFYAASVLQRLVDRD